MSFRLSSANIMRCIVVLIIFALFNSLLLRKRVDTSSVTQNIQVLKVLDETRNVVFSKQAVVPIPTQLSSNHLQKLPEFNQEVTAVPTLNVPGMLNHLQFRYLIQEEHLCTNRHENANVLIYVHTSPSNIKYRNVIRSTWGKGNLLSKLGMFLVFFMGQSLDANLASTIEMESDLYHDIIQEDFIDSYHNLSYKGIAALRWVTNYCKTVEYVVKTDDDMLVNVYSLNRFLKKMKLRDDPFPNKFLCMVFTKMPVLRNVNSKWYVSNETYSEDFYPVYCSGSTYIMPRNIVPRLYNATFRAKFIWVDDAYITGFLAIAANVSHENIGQYYIIDEKKHKQSLIYGDAMFGHVTGMRLLQNRIKYWQQIQQIEIQGNQ